MIFYNARIITMECVTYENGFIETNGTKILRMGRTSALEGTSADDIDCKGKTIPVVLFCPCNKYPRQKCLLTPKFSPF